MQLNFIDFLIIGFYFLFVLLIGVLYARRAGKGIDEYFVSGRNLPWWLIGTSMVATTFATDTPNLVANIVREHGVSGNWVWWAFLLTGMVTVFFYAKLWRRSGALTDIGFYEMRYSGKPAAFLRGFRAIYLGVFFNIIIMATVTLAAIKISSIVLGFDKYVTILTCGIVTAIYSCTAGLWGVVITDVFLFIMAMAGSIGAAYYCLGLPEVGGLSGLLQHPNVSGNLSILPDFSSSEGWKEAVPIFIIPFAVQWWSVWYPGAEPGGGGYVAQRMLAAKDEKNSILATLWFNVAHYAIRPWPWILVALCSMIVFPDLASIQARFPNVPAALIGHDISYPAMMTLLPAGLLGLVMASLAAAYMSTISTHLNWGASYVIDDFYKRFICPDAAPQHYVTVARIVTVALMVLACVFTFFLETALDSFQILLQIGAGTGLIFMLRWFWWRINAWSEISAMTVSFMVALYFRFFHEGVFHFADLEVWLELIIGVAVTTVTWVIVTFLTPPTEKSVLQSFYDKIQPMGPGWSKAVQTSDVTQKDNFTAPILAVFLGMTAVYSALFSLGFFLYGNIVLGTFLAGTCVISSVCILKILPRMNWRD